MRAQLVEHGIATGCPPAKGLRSCGVLDRRRNENTEHVRNTAVGQCWAAPEQGLLVSVVHPRSRAHGAP